MAVSRVQERDNCRLEQVNTMRSKTVERASSGTKNKNYVLHIVSLRCPLISK